MEVTAHLFRHVAEDQEHRKTANPKIQGRITPEGVAQVIDTNFFLRERIPDEPNVDVEFRSSRKLRARATALGPYGSMLARYKQARLHSPKIDDELDPT